MTWDGPSHEELMSHDEQERQAEEDAREDEDDAGSGTESN